VGSAAFREPGLARALASGLDTFVKARGLTLRELLGLAHRPI
jgi:hypothetical protein